MPLLNGNFFTLASLEPEGDDFDDFQSLPDQEKPNRVLIETKVPASRKLKQRLFEVNLEPERNLGDNTWLCKSLGNTDAGIDLNSVKRLDLINIARTVPLSLKIQPSLKTGDETATHVVDIVLYGPEPEDSIHELSRRISRAVGGSAKTLHFRCHNSIIRLETPQSSLPVIAQDPRVSAIEQVHELELHNNVARGVIHADVLINDTPFKGEGEIITVADSGFDKGSTTDTHPAFTGRVRDLFAVGREKTGKVDDTVGHGTVSFFFFFFSFSFFLFPFYRVLEALVMLTRATYLARLWLGSRRWLVGFHGWDDPGYSARGRADRAVVA